MQETENALHKHHSKKMHKNLEKLSKEHIGSRPLIEKENKNIGQI